MGAAARVVRYRINCLRTEAKANAKPPIGFAGFSAFLHEGYEISVRAMPSPTPSAAFNSPPICPTTAAAQPSCGRCWCWRGSSNSKSPSKASRPSPQFAFLRSEGCAEVQGYLFSPPKPATAFVDLAALQFGAIAGSARSLPAAKLIDLGDRRKRA